MPEREEMEQILSSLMDNLHDRAGTGGKSDDDIDIHDACLEDSDGTDQ